MIQFNWNITAMSTLPQVDGQTDVVVLAQWICAGDESGTKAEIGGNTQFTLSPDAKNFIPYSSLTEAEVIQWVFDALGENGINNTQACVQGQIDSILNTPVSPSNQELPWVTAENNKVAEFNAKTFTIG
jgi:hypothetical protein